MTGGIPTAGRVQKERRTKGVLIVRSPTPQASDAARDLFIGRKPELRELARALTAAQQGQGRLVLLSGEPGIGKSRLVAEFATSARDNSVPVLWGRCWEAGGAPAYWPWVQLLRSHLRSEDPDVVRSQIGSGAADIAQILPEIRDLFPDLPSQPTPDPDSARFQLFDSTATFLVNAAKSDPLVLVLEDVHAADTPSLLLLRFLADQIGRAALLVLATYRDVELTPDHPLTRTIDELSREPSTQHLHLHGLSEDDVLRFVSAATDVAPSQQVASALYRETNGNPLFLGEAVRLLAAEGKLTDAATIRITVPVGVRDVIGRRVGRLDDESRRMLSLASVLGTEFTAEALRRMNEMTLSALLDVLDRVTEAGLVQAIPGALGRFRFSHEVVRETLYENQSSTGRMGLHLRAAQVLQQIYGADEESHLAELAHHFFQAAPLGQAASAVEYARRAGEEAVRSVAYEEAARLFRMAVDACELGEPVDREGLGELFLSLGDAQSRAGDLPTARETFLRAATNAKRFGIPAQLGRAALGYGGRFIWERAGDDPHVVPLLQDALVLLGGVDDRLRARLLARLACALRSSPDREQSDALSQEAVRVARTLHDLPSLAYTLGARFWATYWPENPEERLRLADEVLRVSEQANDPELIFNGHQVRMMALTDVGAVAEARAELEAMLSTAEELRQPAQRWAVRWFAVTIALLEGDYARAMELTPDAGLIRARDEGSVFQIHQFFLRREQGQLAGLEEPTRATVEEYPWYPLHRAALALLLIDLGREDEARTVFDDLGTDGFRALYRDSEWLLGMGLAGEACARLHDTGAAAVLYEELAPFSGRHLAGWGEGSIGAADRYLGLLALTLGRRDEAARHLHDAIEMNERMGARPWTAHSRSDLADVLLERDGPGDRERAIAELRSAGETAGMLGMTVLGERVERRLRDLEVGRTSDTAAAAVGPHVVRREGEYWTIVFGEDAFRLKDTKGLQYLATLLAEPGREFHVLDLVADGSTSPEIRAKAAEVTSTPFGDAGPILDPEAKASYKRRLDELDAELADAESMGDSERVERARSERAFIATELAAAVGLGGRDRVAASVSERARVNVTRAIKAAMDRIRDHSPALDAHLAATIRTGTYCSYSPDPLAAVRWGS
jgi:tetratricopeptide (TPR) repeat protein